MQASTEPVGATRPAATPIEERLYPSLMGFGGLAFSLAVLTAGIVFAATKAAPVGVAIALFAASALAFGGLTAIKPGEVRVVELFGGYRGTVRTPGLRWVNPFALRRRVSVRI